MNCANTVLTFAFCAALGSTGPAFGQTPVDDTTPATTAAPVAYVYIQTPTGINLYNTAANGNLTLVESSPFAITGQMEDDNGSYLIGVDTDYIHTYIVESNGAVGKQASEINTQDYRGSACGAANDGSPQFPNGSVLDHTGKYLYVSLWISESSCAAWQSYQIAPNGDLTFLGDVLDQAYSDGVAYPSSVPTVSSKDNFEYGVLNGYEASYFSAFTSTPGGTLEINSKFTEVDPPANPNTPNGPWSYLPVLVNADPAGHLAALLVNATFSECCQTYEGPLQLASYTINSSTGGITSTNTWKDMPTVGQSFVMDMSPSGKLLALAGGEGWAIPGLQIFHFNGAAPITSYSGLLLPDFDVDLLAWDNSNHLYALSYAAERMHVFTVTPTSISEVSGSPFTIRNAYGLNGLIVVPKH